MEDLELADRVQIVNILIGNTSDSIFYPLFEDEQIEYFLKMKNGDVYQAARLAATSAAFKLAQTSNRERVGDVEVWNEAGKQYRAALKDFLDETRNIIHTDAFPWAAGIDSCELQRNLLNPKLNKSPLVRLPVFCQREWLMSNRRFGCVC